MVSLLNEISGISCISPKGAFYVFANVSKTNMNDTEFCDFILDNAGVAACPGSYFGNSGKGYVRYCFDNSKQNIKKGLLKLKKLFD